MRRKLKIIVTRSRRRSVGEKAGGGDVSRASQRTPLIVDHMPNETVEALRSAGFSMIALAERGEEKTTNE